MPSNGHALDLDRFLPYRLSVLTNRVSNAIARHYVERFDLSPPEWRVMAALGQSPGLSAREVALRTEMDKVQVSRAVSGLVAARRVKKQTDAHDGRITRLVLTSRGLAIYQAIVPEALALEERFLAALGPAERVALNRMIEKLSDEARSLAAVPPGYGIYRLGPAFSSLAEGGAGGPRSGGGGLPREDSAAAHGSNQASKKARDRRSRS
ncbi:MAG TPA: MarR family winged helix-turn-helix transcriptional regulator [Rhizomicrobium sp.]|jgi:DNA-binding MarR family transcriptional regulator